MSDKEIDHQGPLHERLKTIVGVEKQIDDLLKVSKDCLQELAKEKQISKAKMEESSTSFRKLLSQIETELSSQLQYLGNVCVGSSHQGSTFGAHQNAQLAQSGVSSLHQNIYNILARLKEDEEPAECVDEPTTSDDVGEGDEPDKETSAEVHEPMPENKEEAVSLEKDENTSMSREETSSMNQDAAYANMNREEKPTTYNVASTAFPFPTFAQEHTHQNQ